MPHENEPEFVARARYAIFLDDRQYGRLNDEQAARILQDIRQNLRQDEKVNSRFVKPDYTLILSLP